MDGTLLHSTVNEEDLELTISVDECQIIVELGTREAKSVHEGREI